MVIKRASLWSLPQRQQKNWLLFLCGMTLFLLSSGARARINAHDYDANLRTVRMLLGQPESRMDLASIKLTVDQILDPSIDKAAVLKQVDDMAVEVRRSFPIGASNLAKLKALRDYLYHPAPLSGRQPFLYNFADDRNPKAKLLSVYLTTHRGNCVSMPLLFVVLGQRLGIPVTLTTAPAHLYRQATVTGSQFRRIEA